MQFLGGFHQSFLVRKRCTPFISAGCFSLCAKYTVNLEATFIDTRLALEFANDIMCTFSYAFVNLRNPGIRYKRKQECAV